MNRKILLAVSSALYGASLGAVAFNADSAGSSDTLNLTSQHQIVKESKSYVRSKLSEKIKIEQGLQGKHTYMVRLKDKPVATYDGSVKGLTATSPQVKKTQRARLNITSVNANKKSSKLDFTAPEVKAYVNYLASEQQNFLNKVAQNYGEKKPKRTYQYSLNAMTLELTQAEAVEIAKMKDVAFIERSQPFKLDTDTGPTHIGAAEIWNGNATGIEYKGEGVIVGIIDTGINTDHPSFADVGDDGYDHTNPNGSGVYVGDCAGAYPELCNDKLIGVRSYTKITDAYQDAAVFGPNLPEPNGEDYNGHGSHTASTSAGNVLTNVPMLDPEFGQEEGNGVNSTGFEFAQISGVAPHANIISYQVCYPGEEVDKYHFCNIDFATNDAIEDAITDGVDVINYSIGGGGAWLSSTELAFLSAQQAGIFVATSAGNSGPTASTTKGAPWYTTVAASTHGRTVEFAKTIGDFNGGDTTPPSTINGFSATGGITAPIVYAGNFDNPNDDPADDAAQCLADFPAGTFSGEIVVCDRGAIARVDKAAHVFAGGAGGFVLANLQGGAASVNNDVYVIPGIHIDADGGDALKAWLDSGAGHTATITAAAGELVIGQADDIAEFSSRGPNPDVADVMAPSIAAPGVNIYAGYADQQFGHEVSGSAPSDFAFLSGTSMASPHVVGAAALLKGLHPSWTPDNIRSAMMLTATAEMKKEDGVTPADIWDMGSGRVRVDMAAKSGLLMNETEENYLAANPDDGGDPKTLNIPSMGNTSCNGSCSWQRTFTATVDGDWTTSAISDNSGLTVTVEPASFSIVAGDTQTITVTAVSNGLRTGDEVTGVVTLTPTDSSVPTANLPLFLTVNTSNIPSRIEMEVHRDAGSVVLRNNLALEISQFTPRVYGLSKATKTNGAVGQDSNNGSAYDDLADGQTTTWMTVAEASSFLRVAITDAESPDFDLRVGIDANGDGIPDEDEELCQAATGAANEVCEIEEVDAGDYWILVQNWAASAPDAEDGYTLVTGYVPSASSDNFTLTAQASASEFTPFDIRMNWSDDMEEGDVFIGAFDVSTDADEANAGNLGSTLVMLTRGQDDASLTASTTNPAVGDTVDFTMTILANLTDEDDGFSVNANIPEGIVVDPDTIIASSGTAGLISGGIEGANITWAATRPGLKDAEPSYVTTDNVTDASCGLPNFGQGNGYIDLAAFGVSQGTLDGDTVNGAYGVGATLLGQAYSSVTVTDDGFITMGTYGGAPWVNQNLPNSDIPNAVIAPFWRDMQLDVANGSGVSVATAGPTWTIIEYDDMRHYAYYNGAPQVDDVLDFEVVFNNSNGDIMYAYDNVTHNFGDALGQTIGWENSSGTNGANYIYADGGDGGVAVGTVADVVDGLVVCNRLVLPTTPVIITFSGRIADEAAGSTLTSTLASDSTNVGAQEEVSYLSINVQSNLAISAIADDTVAEEGTLTGIVVEYTDNDAVANTITVTSDNGVASNISGGASGSTFDFTPNTDFVGDLEVTVTVTDNEKPADNVSTTFTVTVTNVNDAPTASPRASQSITTAGSTITLKANGFDVDGDDLTYSWTQTGGHSVSIANASAAVATVSNANTETGDLTFQVTVSDGTLESSSSVTIHVTKAYSGSGSFGWMLLVLLGALGIGRKRLK